MSDIAEALRLGKEIVEIGSGGLGDQAGRMLGGAEHVGVRPEEFDFTPAPINAQVDKALGFPHIRSPMYAEFPAVDRYPTLAGSQHPIYDVVIAGAGLLGTQTARVLAAEGKNVAVLESGFVGDGASGALAGMGTRGLDASYPELRKLLGDQQFAAFVKAVRKASLAIKWASKPLSETRFGISSHMYSYDVNDPKLIAEYRALHPFDRATSLSVGQDAARIVPAAGNRPAAGTVMSFLGESRVDPRQFTLAMLDHPNITTFEHSPVVGIRTGLADKPIEIHTTDGVVRGKHFVAATGHLPTMFGDHVSLLDVAQARMIRGLLPDSTEFVRDNYFDFLNPLSKRSGDYAWWLMPKEGEVYLGADCRFLTHGDRATQGVGRLKDTLRFTFPGVTIPRGAKSWGSVLQSTVHGGPFVDTLPTNSHVIGIYCGGGTGLVNGRMGAWAGRDLINGAGKNKLFSAQTLEQLAVGC